MRLVLQRVSAASVKAGGETVGEIDRGLLVLVGIERGDGPEKVRAAADKLAGLRVFEDAAGKMNLDLAAVGGAFLVVSQFTLAGSLARGRRPSFDRAAPPEEAEPLVDALVAELRGRGFRVETGRFRARTQKHLRRQPFRSLVSLQSLRSLFSASYHDAQRRRHEGEDKQHQGDPGYFSSKRIQGRGFVPDRWVIEADHQDDHAPQGPSQPEESH